MCEILQSFPKAFIGKLSAGTAVEAYLLSGKQQVEQLHALVLVMLYSSSSGGSQKAYWGTLKFWVDCSAVCYCISKSVVFWNLGRFVTVSVSVQGGCVLG